MCWVFGLWGGGGVVEGNGKDVGVETKRPKNLGGNEYR